MLRAIALLKALQAITLFAVALAALHMLRPDVVLLVQAWMRALPVEAEQDMLQGIGRWAGSLLPHQVAGVAIGAFLYGVLFAVESVGLWRRRIWAEWLTVIATGLLIPVEIWEVLVRVSPLRVLALTVNVAVVWYLVRQLQRNVARHRLQAADAAQRTHDAGIDEHPDYVDDEDAQPVRRSA